jgi:DNA polymerase III subunit gamma/tau
MSYQVLARKYRPQKFSEVIGQNHVTRTLKNALEQGRTAHGYIFSGHRGIGKTTIARILAMALNCRASDKPGTEPCGICESCTEIRAGNSVDVIEIDAATNRGIDEIRELREAARYKPARDRFKIYILDEAHQITDAAFNALLKTLEEPPPHMVFMLATTQPEDIPQTIRSRCQHFCFRAVSYEEILGQLKSIAAQEKISADDDALALLAEAGDGSMRDALSIFDQAIASSNGPLDATQIRQLVGTVPSGVMEEVMQSVALGTSEPVLQLIDRLISDGQSPTHFARQMVRFLRNAIVAKVAGTETSLLQISSDERARVGRVAETFSEEDLTRHLQIMLRTHSELGYRQEQRFHLELGLLKMTHAQRLLPIEQLLSEAGLSAVPQPKISKVADIRRSDPTVISRPAAVSPFAADSARKSAGKPQMSSDSEPAAMRPSGNTSMPPVIMGAAALAEAAPEPTREPAIEAAPEPRSTTPPEPISSERIASAALDALNNGGHRILASMLESGEWTLAGSEVVIKVATSAAVIDMSMGADAKRLVVAAISGLIGAPAKLKVISGATAAVAAPKKELERQASPVSGRGRAEQDPVVRKMKEVFGAEIRTIIDYKERR